GPRMDQGIAFEMLGLPVGAPWPEVRATYLRLVRQHHPDTAVDLADAGRRTVRTAQITEAYALLASLRARPAQTPADRGARPARWRFDDALDDSRRVLLDASFDHAFVALLEVAHLVGAVSYVDRGSGVLEVIVTPAPTQATSLIIYLEPGEDLGVTEAVFGVEPLGSHPPAPLDDLVDHIAVLLATPRPPAPD
ncbi:MAG: J domain-containing protein, partial [Acidimicrobiia bacterium]